MSRRPAVVEALRRYRAGIGRRARGPLSLLRWYATGCPDPPPPALKHRVLVRYARKYRLEKFVETGTFLGETSAVLAKHVSDVLTVELSPELAQLARHTLRRLDNVQVLEGDSGRLLPGIVAEIHEPALFWLDGHYSEGTTARGEEETPVRTELEAIFTHARGDHVILIDDARCFSGGAYPTLSELREQVHRLAPEYRMELSHDIVRLLPPNSPATG